MSKIIDKIITSIHEPDNTKVVWHNPETGQLKIFGNKGWEVVGGGGSEVSSFSIDVLWKELKELRDFAKLIPGMSYRITDYVATTIDPESRSANHPFDIIVIANDEKTLNENARAIAHDGDTYFEKCNLSAWELKYCLDNDTERFSWAQDAFDGYSIYVQDLGAYVNASLISSNDTTYDGCPYHFIAIFETEKIDIYSQALNGPNVLIYVSIAPNMELNANITHVVMEEGKGVIYRMIDENNNDIPYDFKGIQFKRYKITATNGTSKDLIGKYTAKNNNILTIDEEDFCWCYLFNAIISGESEDNSVGFYLGIPISCKAQDCGGTLINAVCMGVCYSWSCGTDCFGWTCGDNCYYWKCGNGCYNWTCGNNCFLWKCGNYCFRWTCGDYCNYWKCYDSCNEWTCGSSCDTFTSNIDCSNWLCSDNCRNFTILYLNRDYSTSIPFVANVEYPQFACINSQGILKIWNPADNV